MQPYINENVEPLLDNSDSKTAEGGGSQKRLFVIGDCGHKTVDQLLEKLYKDLPDGADVIINGDFFYPGIDTTHPKNIIHNNDAFKNYMQRFKDLDNHLKQTNGQLMFSIGNHERGNGAKFQGCNKTYSLAVDSDASDANARELVKKLYEMGFTCFLAGKPDADLKHMKSFHYTTPDRRIFVLDSTVFPVSDEQKQDLTDYLTMYAESVEPIVVSHHPVETTSKYEKKHDKAEHSYPHDAGTGKNHNQLVEQALFECMSAAHVNSITLLAAHMHTSEYSIRTYKDMTIYCAIEGTGALAEAKGPLLFSSGYLALSYNKKDGHITALDRKVAVTETLFERHKIPSFLLLAALAYFFSDFLKNTEIFQQLIEWETQGKFVNQTALQEGIVGVDMFAFFSLLLISLSCCLRCCPASKHKDCDYSKVFPSITDATSGDVEEAGLFFRQATEEVNDLVRYVEKTEQQKRMAS